MCGRFTQTKPSEEISAKFHLRESPRLLPRYNISPGQEIPCVRAVPNGHIDERECVFMKWGLIPSWARSSFAGRPLINARAETVATKPAFRRSFRSRRCLVLADGFYEWKQEGRRKQPYYIRLRSHDLFAFAGLWDRSQLSSETTVETCAILTTEANPVMAAIHHRMPVILEEHQYDQWLDFQTQEVQHLQALLRPSTRDDLIAVPVEAHVNNPRIDEPSCIQAAMAGL